jgi:hypothetical protein
MIVKVKEPQPQECADAAPGPDPVHLPAPGARPGADRGLVKSGAVCVAYETITGPGGGLPLLAPMSEVAGRMAIQAGAAHLEKSKGGMGLLLGGVPGVPPAQVLILGAGVVGTNALQMAVGLGAASACSTATLDRLRHLDLVFGNRIETVYSTTLQAIEEHALQADLVIGRRADPRCGGAQAGDARHGVAHEARRGGGGRGHRPGRLLRNLARHHARRPDLRGGRRHPLLRGQHARRGGAHLDLRAEQRHHRPRAGAGRQGLARAAAPTTRTCAPA